MELMVSIVYNTSARVFDFTTEKQDARYNDPRALWITAIARR